MNKGQIDLLENLSIGVDIEEVERFRKLDITNNKSFFKKIYTPKEIKHCLKRSDPSFCLAVRFAGKEAIMKALSQFSVKASPREIEILNDKKGAPSVKISSVKTKNIKVIISLSHTKRNAIAFALGVKTKNG